MRQLFQQASLAILGIAALPMRLEAQCTVASTPLAFEPSPPGVSRPGTLPFGFSTSLGLYRNSAGAPRMLMFEAWGYSTLDLTNPGSPVALKYDDLRLDPTTATTNPIHANGDGQSYIQTVGVSADGARIISSVNGPAEPTWHNLVGRSDGGEGFGMWGDFGDSRASGTVIVQNGARYIAFATHFTNPLIVSDVTTLTTVNANFQSLNLASETTGFPPGYALSTTGNFVVYTQTSGGGIQIIDASTPGPLDYIAFGFKTTTLTGVPGDPFARVPKNYAASVDPFDSTKLWVLVELAASAANGENSPSYGLVSISKDGNGNFQAPVSAGSVFRVPSQAGENWGMSGGSASLVVSQGQLFAIMWATRQTPTQQFALYTSSTTWAPTGGVVTTPPGFGLAATSAAALAGTVNSVYQYLPAGPKAWVVPMSCTPVNAPAVSTLTVTNASAGGTPVADGGTVFFGEQLSFGTNIVPSPLSKPLTFWSFDFNFHAGNGIEDNGALPRVKNSDMNQATNGAAPPATITLIGPCDPRASGSPSSGLGCWASVQTNSAAGGPDYVSPTPAPGSTAPLKMALEAANQFGQTNTAVFTVSWKVPAARVASSQILSGQPLVSASDGHPSGFKWWFGSAPNNLTVNASCTTASCTPPGGTNFYWVTATYLNGYSTADYDGTAVVGLPFTVTSFVPVFTVNGVSTGPITAYTFQTLLIQNNSQRGTGITANYQYYLCQAPCPDNDSGYVTFPLPDSAGGSTTIPVPTTPGSWALRIKANNSGPSTPARWPDPATVPAGFPITVSNAPPPIVVTVGASPNPANPGQVVTLSCSATGGTGSGYTYEWSGTVGGPFSTQQNFSFTASNGSSVPVTSPYYCTVHDSAGGSGINNVNVQVNGSPPTIVVTVGASPNPVSLGDLVQLTCSASGGTGPYDYFWSLSDGGVGAGSPFGHVFGATGAFTAICTAFDTGTSRGGQNSLTVNVSLPPGSGGPYFFSALNPCRVLDTRNASGQLGGPAIQPAGVPDRSFSVASFCGIPFDAKAISINATMTNVTSAGAMLLYRGDGQPSGASSASLVPGRTRANNAMVQLALDGSGTIKVQNTSSGTFDLIVDVNGYFR